MSAMISKQDVLGRTNNGLNVFLHYYPEPIGDPTKKIRNPFYDDRQPSAHFYMATHLGMWIFKDFGNNGESMDCFEFAAKTLGLDVRRNFRQVLQQIDQDLQLGLGDGRSPLAPRRARTLAASTPTPSAPPSDQPVPSPFEVEFRDWDAISLAFWERYGIMRPVLDRYHVRCVHQFRSENQQGKPYTIRWTNEDPIFGYEQAWGLKLYRPHAKKARFLYGGSKPGDYCFGFAQLPKKSRMVFITGGEKDVLTLAAHGYPAICLNSETASLPSDLAKSLGKRFDFVVVLYDADDTGRRASMQMLDLLTATDVRGFRVDLPLSGEKANKDVSDFFLHGGTVDALDALVNQSLYQHYISVESELEGLLTRAGDIVPAEGRIFSVRSVPLGTRGDLLCVGGKEGVGKSQFLAALLSGCISPVQLPYQRTLGVDVRANASQQGVLYFDTEQSQYNNKRLFNRIMHRTGYNPPRDLPFFYPIKLRELTKASDRLEVIEKLSDVFHAKHNGLHTIVIDGVADLVEDINDLKESLSLINKLLKMASYLNTCVVCMLHTLRNESKLRGHLGTVLQQKAGTVLEFKRNDETKLTCVEVRKSRNYNPLDLPRLVCGWNSDTLMLELEREDCPIDREVTEDAMLVDFLYGLLHEEHVGQLAVDEFRARLGSHMNVGPDRCAAFFQRLLSQGYVCESEGIVQLVRS